MALADNWLLGFGVAIWGIIFLILAIASYRVLRRAKALRLARAHAAERAESTAQAFEVGAIDGFENSIAPGPLPPNVQQTSRPHTSFTLWSPTTSSRLHSTQNSSLPTSSSQSQLTSNPTSSSQQQLRNDPTTIRQSPRRRPSLLSPRRHAQQIRENVALIRDALILPPQVAALHLSEVTGDGQTTGLTLEEIDRCAPIVMSPAAVQAQSNPAWKLQQQQQQSTTTSSSVSTQTTSKQDLADLTSPISEQASTDELCCAICLDEITDDQDRRVLPCKHMFHPLCIQLWLPRANRCPSCQVPVSPREPPPPPTTAPSTPLTARQPRRSRASRILLS